jgi:hypothetical protein
VLVSQVVWVHLIKVAIIRSQDIFLHFAHGVSRQRVGNENLPGLFESGKLGHGN